MVKPIKPDHVKCQIYGRFMSHLTGPQAESIFWGLFAFGIFLLIFAASSHAEAEKLNRSLIQAEDDQAPEKGKYFQKWRENQRGTRIGCVIVTTLCAILEVVCVIMQAFAALSLQYCHSVDLINFYWGFWTLLQVGALIAILGITAHQWYSLGDHDHPPWNVALGTPVLVISGLAQMMVERVRSKWSSYGVENGLPLTQSNTTVVRTRVVDFQVPGSSLFGFATDGGPIIQFPKDSPPPRLPAGSEVVGCSSEGGPIIRYQPEITAQATLTPHLSGQVTLASTCRSIESSSQHSRGSAIEPPPRSSERPSPDFPRLES